MNYWLVKSDPDTYGWEEFKKDKTTTWDGVRNFAARNFLKGMKKGDAVLFYHSGKDRSVVGLASVHKEYFRDPTTDEDAWVAVGLKADKPLSRPVSLADIKSEKRLKDIPLLKIGRLSVMPLKKAEFDLIVEMGGK